MNNNMSPMEIAKRVLLGTVAVVIFFVVLSFTRGMTMHNSLGLSGGVTAFVTPPMMGNLQVGRGGSVYAQPALSEKMLAVREDSVGYGRDAYGEAVSVPVPTSPAAPPLGDAKIIKSGNLDLLVKNVEEAGAAINATRARLGGQPGNASFSEYRPGMKQGDITIWVPSEKFDEALSEIKKIALRVESESVNVQDVSAQFVDIISRLKNLKAAESAYVEIMKRSGKISEVLEVTRALNDTRSQIEQQQGQLDYISRQVSLSSIHVSLREEAVPGSVTSGWRPLTVIKAAAKQTLGDLTGIIDSLLVLVVRLPVLILQLGFWVLIFWGLYRLAHVLFKKMKASSIFGGPTN